MSPAAFCSPDRGSSSLAAGGFLVAAALSLLGACRWVGTGLPRGLLPLRCPAPKCDVTASPGADLAALARTQPEGAVICLAAGEYRMQSVRPRRGQTFVGELDPVTCRRTAVLNGSRLLTEFGREGSLFLARGQTQAGQIHGRCQKHAPRCSYPEDFFIDDRRLWHVDAKEKVRPGAYFFDYDTDTIWFADDPRGHKVETSVARAAFLPTADDVTIENLVIEKYAVPAQMGAIGDQKGGRNWVIRNNEVRLNHGAGVKVGSGSRVVGNFVHDNGQLGVTAVGAEVLFEGNEIAFNGGLGFSCEWECGGGKFALTDGLIVRENRVHDNDGPGLWTDIDNVDTVYEGNVVERNRLAGIKHEISYNAVIRDNVIRYNGRDFDVWGWGAQVEVQNSQRVQVVENEVVVAPDGGNGVAIIHQRRGGGRLGPWLARDNLVSNNTIVYEGRAGRSGLFADDQRAEVAEWNNRFERNRFRVVDPSISHWHWLRPVSFAEFVELNRDRDSRLEIGSCGLDRGGPD